MIDVERLRRADEIVQAALDGGAVELPTLLDAECAGDALLRAEVESLLGYRERAKDFIETPAFALGAGLFADGSDGDSASAEGRRIGPYRVVREVGRGGMGAVYLAERADGEFRQQVAVKVIRQTLAGSETRRHFKRERQILASLNHPNIARLLDGGVSEDGEPFLAMEYVEGERIDVYAGAHQLSTDARLNLFRHVCSAVHYAHQNLVIHRDIKPSNILVTAEGVPKLLDFGVAKLLDPESVDAGAHTLTELGVMTPEYASPEQIRGESVTTASDVYSLGVVLYELLAGHRPYRVKSRKPDEIARAICEQEPERPSAAVGRIEDPPKADGSSTPTITPGTVSRARSEQPERLRRRLAGDLDNIVLMAMRKEPARRYASVGQFSEDIRRHMDGLPVIARKDTFKYRGAKFVKRNKVGVAAAALVVLTLIGGIVGVAWQARAAQEQARVAAQERDRAQREATKAERVSQFFQNMLSYIDPTWYAPGREQRGEVRMIDALDGVAGRIDREFTDQPDVRSELHRTVGDIYRTLGRFDVALSHFRRAWEASREAYGEQHSRVAYCLYHYAAMHEDMDEKELLYRQAISMMRATDPENIKLPFMLQDFGSLLIIKGDAAAAEPFLREALELSRRHYGDDHPMVAVSLDCLGDMYQARGELEQAEAMLREAVERNRRSSSQQLLSGALEKLAQVKVLQGEYAEAEASLREALDLRRRTLGSNHPEVASIFASLAHVRFYRGDYVEAEELVGTSLEIRQGKSPNEFIGPWIVLGKILTRTNRAARGETYLRRALEAQSRTFQQGHQSIADAQGALGENLVAQRRYAEAEPLLAESHNALEASLGQQDPRTREARRRLVALYEAWQKLDAAARLSQP